MRGIGNSRDVIKPDYYQYNIYNLNNKEKYIYRDVYMDCLRGLDFICRNSSLKLDTANIIIKGSGQGATLAAATAAMDHRVSGLILDRPLYMDMRSMIQNAEVYNKNSWPASVFINYYESKYNGLNKEAFLKTWDYFDPVYFAPYISCPVLVGFTMHSTVLPPQCVYVFLGQLRVGKKDTYVCYDCENSMEEKYYGFENMWIGEIFKL